LRPPAEPEKTQDQPDRPEAFLAEPKLILYHNDMSSSSQKVRLCLAEKGLAWTSKHVSLRDGEHQQEWYRAINARAVVPTLVDDECPIQESTVINEYLDAKFGANPLMPPEPLGQARVRYWTKQVDDALHDGCIAVLAYAIAFRDLQLKNVEAARAGIERIPDVFKRERRRDVLENGLESPHVAMALSRLLQLFQELDRAVSAGPWILGDRYTLADVALVPYVTRIADLNILKMAAGYPNVLAWFDRCKARPGYAEAVTKWDDPALLSVMKNGGEKYWPKLQALLATAA
jgi:glutathione S-transferase